jgi:hypothetical protein
MHLQLARPNHPINLAVPGSKVGGSNRGDVPHARFLAPQQWRRTDERSGKGDNHAYEQVRAMGHTDLLGTSGARSVYWHQVNSQRSNDPTIQGESCEQQGERPGNQLFVSLPPRSFERLCLDRWIVGSLEVDPFTV